MKKFFIACAVLFSIPCISSAATASYLGRSITMTPPPGYCEFGLSRTQAEVELMAFQKQNTSLSGELAQLSVPCEELKAFLKGETSEFTRWAQILVLKAKGGMRVFPGSRESFVQRIGGAMAGKPIDMKSVENRMRDHLAKTGSSVNNAEVTPLGSTNEAAFMDIRASISVHGYTTPISAIAAMTLINGLPVGIYVYTTPKAKHRDIMGTTQQYLRGVIASNP